MALKPFIYGTAREGELGKTFAHPFPKEATTMNVYSTTLPFESGRRRRNTYAKVGLLGIAALALTIALPAGAQAAPITLTLTGPIPGNTVGPQSNTNPCIIAGTTCQQPATMGYNNFKQQGNITAYNTYSTNQLPSAELPDGTPGTPYTVGQLKGLGSSAFSVGIDVNTAAGEETLQLFEVIIGGNVVYNYTGPKVIGAINNNGNGYADWVLSSIDLSGYTNDTTVLFHAIFDHTSDGAESFFLLPGVANPPTIPEPTSLVLLGSGLLIGVRRFRSRRTQ